ncbi:HipA domain-containing protein [Microbacterium sp. AZCO]|uniref:HipA domain-containing protein n=1 Tax=Microbacterium sp. AZCO TaxID=3142976 RepID=UPI0031F341FE
MRLTAYLDGARVGWFTQNDFGDIVLEFDPTWQRDAGRVELSLSLPKSRRRHEGSAPGNFLWNLLPDNSGVLNRWGRTFGVSSRNPMALLGNVGLDAAGAVQLVDSTLWDGARLEGPASVEWVDEAVIAAHLRLLRDDPTAWVAAEFDGGYFSLAGAQSKFTLVRGSGKWGFAKGRAASTHIVKPGIAGLTRGDLNEHLTMRAAHHLHLDVARSRMVQFEDESAIVVERYDRYRQRGEQSADALVGRRHQEDFAQATGTHPSSKYQNEGGPSIASITNLILESFGPASVSEALRFFEATIFNWAALGTDAHAKNYALLSSTARTGWPTLSPLYDLGSALAYPEINNRRAKLAMSFDGHYRTFEIEPRHILREAAIFHSTLGQSTATDWVYSRAQTYVEGLPDALSLAVEEASLRGQARDFAVELIDRASERTKVLQQQLDQRP